MLLKKESIIPLSKVRINDYLYVGNKASVLGELIRNNINIPDGFCITTLPFTKLTSSFLIGSNTKTINNFQKIQKKILKNRIAKSFCTEIKSALNNIKRITNSSPMFCVRSSSPLEDRPDFSFAGCFSSSIGLVTTNEIIDAIKKCWASLFRQHVQIYISRSKIDFTKATMAVLIQILVPAEKSGVLFTYDPIKKENTILIEATWGLGSSIVNGHITPDQISLTKKGSIINTTIGSKKHALIVENKRLKKISTEIAKKNTLCLDEKEIILLHEEAKKIVQILGKAQNIEFSFYRNNLWILQSRPITGLNP